MAISGENNRSSSDSNVWKLCTFWQSTNHTTSSTSSTQQLHQHHLNHRNGDYQPSDRASLTLTSPSKPTVTSVARSLLPAKRRLRLDPSNRLYFPYEPGKQVRSAVRIKNTSKSYVAFKFQTTSPKSCYMRPPGGILAPGESLVATVFKFVEQPENNEKLDLKTNVKFKIMSLKVKEGIEYAPELFEEQRDQATVERILRVIFLDPERPSSAMDKLRRQLAEADAAVESQKKPPPSENGPRVVGEGLVIDEWKERREKYLAQQQGEAVESV